MRTLMFSLFALVAAVACSAPKKPATMPSTSDQPMAKEGGVPCTAEVARECPEGMTDTCSLGVSSNHYCAAASTEPGVPCDQEVALVCPEGQVDLCLARPDEQPTAHICVIL